MKSLAAALLCIPAIAGADAARPLDGVRVLVMRYTDAGRWQGGLGVMGGWRDTLDLTLGYHVTDRAIVRVRERLAAHEVEAGYAIATGRMLVRPLDAVPRTKLFAVVGAGHAGADRTSFAGALLRVHLDPLIALELGVRGIYVPLDRKFAARAIAPEERERRWATEAWATISLLLPAARRECVVR